MTVTGQGVSEDKNPMSISAITDLAFYLVKILLDVEGIGRRRIVIAGVQTMPWCHYYLHCYHDMERVLSGVLLGRVIIFEGWIK